MRGRISSRIYTLLQMLILGLPLIAYMYVWDATIVTMLLGVIYVVIMRRVLIILDMTIMETSRLREYIEEGRVSGYIEKKYKKEVKKGSQLYKDQIKRNTSASGVEVTRVGGLLWKGYRVKIEDPKTIDVEETQGRRIERIEGKLKINGGGYNLETGCARGILRIQGITKVKEDGEYSVIGITKDGLLKLCYNPTEEEIEEMENAVTFGPHMILDDEVQEMGEFSGVSPRTAIGQRVDGVIVFLIVDGRSLSSIGMTMRGVQKYMRREGCINASMLDGGNSSQLARTNKLLNKTSGRVVNNVFRVK